MSVTDICRLCLSNQGLIDIFERKSNTHHIDERIMFCARVQINKNDGFPSKICQQCLTQLDFAYEFRIQVENADHRLKASKAVGLLKSALFYGNGTGDASMNLQIAGNNQQTDGRHLLHAHAHAHNITAHSQNSTTSRNLAYNPPFANNLVDGFNNNDANNQQQANSNKVITNPELLVCEVPLVPDFENDMTNKYQNSNDDELSKKHQCPTCGKRFSRTYQLNVHARTHTGEKPFKCEMCDKSFRVRHHLQSHVRRHTADKPYQCRQCGKCFSESSSVARHLKIHSKNKNFQCQICVKKFINKNELRKHNNMCHATDKPYQGYSVKLY